MYRKLHAILRKECSEKLNCNKFGEIQLHSYQLKSERAFIVYIRGIHSTVNINDIAKALQELNFNPRRIINVQGKENGQPFARNLFRVELEPDPANSNIYNLPYLLRMCITVEAFRPRTDPPHCRRCQCLGHTKQYCLRDPRCIKCGDNHELANCKLAKSDPCKCANCGEPHPASYRGCPEYQKLRKKKPHSAVDEIRRRVVSSPAVETAPNPLPSHTAPVGSFAAIAANPTQCAPKPSPQPTPLPLTPPSTSRKTSSPTKQQPSTLDAATIELLSSLSKQIADLTKRLDCLEHGASDTNWTKVQRRRNRRND